MATEKTLKKIVDAFMELASEHPYDEVTLDRVAETAGVDLATLRGAYDSRLAIIEDFARRIDVAVLKDSAADDEDDEEAPGSSRDRLFGVMMARFDALAPYRDALRALAKAATADPMLAAAFNRIAVTSSTWMLTAARIEATGFYGVVKAQGLVLVFARAFRTWLDDDDPGLTRTMAILDREITRGASVLKGLEKVGCAIRKYTGRRRCRGEDAATAEPDGGAEAAPA